MEVQMANLPRDFDRLLVRPCAPKRSQLETVIYQLLRLHQGPLIKFAVQVSELRSNPHIDQWVHMLPNDTLQNFALYVALGEKHKLTPHIFTFRHIRDLRLYNTALDPPAGFMGFPQLVNLDLQHCGLVPKNFGKFIASCPSLERLRLVHCTTFDCLEFTGPKLKVFVFHGLFKSVSFKKCSVLRDMRLTFLSPEFKLENGFSYDLVKALSCLPALDELQLQAYALEALFEYGAPAKLPVALKTLRKLSLEDMYFEKVEEVASVLRFIKSCPNLGRLSITAFTFEVWESVANFLRTQRPSYSFTQLKAFKMQLVCGMDSEMELMKYVLAFAPCSRKWLLEPTMVLFMTVVRR